MGKPAARVGDMTAHGGMITGPGVPTVLIGGMPAATMGDMHVCPMVTPGVPPVPHVGGPLVGPVPPTVLIGGKPAACVGDMAICVGPPSSILPPGCPTVLFGQSGGGGGGGGGGSGKDAKSASGDSAESIEPVEGTETFPVEIQRIIANAAKNMTKDQTKAVIDQVAKSLAESGYTGETQQDTYTELTLSDIVEVLKSVEKNESYEAARHFASHLDYGKLTEIAKAFINGEDTNADNDPNLMPTRFMLLYGMEDSKIREMDNHPDRFEDEEHKINVKNLRRGLKLLGHDIKDEDGPFDDEVWIAFVKFLAARPFPNKFEMTHPVEEGEDLGKIAVDYGISSWKYLYEINKEIIGDNPDIFEAGIELAIPQWDDTQGDEEIEKKGARAFDYVNGLRYSYVWVPFKANIVDNVTNMQINFEENKKVKITDKDFKQIYSEFSIKTTENFQLLLPDAPSINVGIPGFPFFEGDTLHIHPDDSGKNQDNSEFENNEDKDTETDLLNTLTE